MKSYTLFGGRFRQSPDVTYPFSSAESVCALAAMDVGEMNNTDDARRVVGKWLFAWVNVSRVAKESCSAITSCGVILAADCSLAQLPLLCDSTSFPMNTWIALLEKKAVPPINPSSEEVEILPQIRFDANGALSRNVFTKERLSWLGEWGDVIYGAVVQLSMHQCVPTSDVLSAAVLAPGVSAAYLPVTCCLYINGIATLASYRDMLGNVTFSTSGAFLSRSALTFTYFLTETPVLAGRSFMEPERHTVYATLDVANGQWQGARAQCTTFGPGWDLPHVYAMHVHKLLIAYSGGHDIPILVARGTQNYGNWNTTAGDAMPAGFAAWANQYPQDVEGALKLCVYMSAAAGGAWMDARCNASDVQARYLFEREPLAFGRTNLGIEPHGRIAVRLYSAVQQHDCEHPCGFGTCARCDAAGSARELPAHGPLPSRLLQPLDRDCR